MNSPNVSHFLAGKRIIVCGGGIAGPVFCIALKQFLDNDGKHIQPPPIIEMYERDIEAESIGREGYSLSIRDDTMATGLQMLQKLNILDEMIAESNTITPFTLFNANFTPLVQTKPSASSFQNRSQMSVRIARMKLRQILLKHMPSSVTIHWNHGVISAHEEQNGTVLIDIDNGKQERCDLLIAADGSNSKIRKVLRPQHQPIFSGAVCIMARTHSLEKLPPPIDVSWGRAFSGSGNFLFVSTSDRTSVFWIVSYLSDTPREPKIAGTMNDDEIDDILAEVKERTKSYGEPMPTILKQTLRNSIAISNSKDIIPFRNHGSVIFIGDAQHAISSFGGNGANMAIMDAYQLAEQLVNAINLAEATKIYDDQTIPRSTKAIDMAHEIITKGHALGSWNSF